MMLVKRPLLLAAMVLSVSMPVMANEKEAKETKAVAQEFFGDNTLDFQYKGNFKNATISVVGPNDFNAALFQKDGSPTFNLSTFGDLADGIYNYEISVATDKKIRRKNNLNNGRGPNARTMINESATQSGSFRVKDGAIVTYQDLSEGGDVK